MKTLLRMLAIIASPLFMACTENSNVDQLDVNKENVSVVPTNSGVRTKAVSDRNKNLFSISYKDVKLNDVPLSENDVNLLRRATSISSPNYVSLKGYAEWTVRTTGHKGGNWYKLAISSKDSTALVCGIAPGIYIARDVWLWQYYTVPTPLTVIIPNNDYNDFTHMGRNPDSLNVAGYKASISGTKVTLQTAATMLKYTLGGAEVLLTYPVKGDNLEWNFSYITIE